MHNEYNWRFLCVGQWRCPRSREFQKYVPTQGGNKGCLLLELRPLYVRALQSVKIDARFIIFTLISPHTHVVSQKKMT